MDFLLLFYELMMFFLWLMFVTGDGYSHIK